MEYGAASQVALSVLTPVTVGETLTRRLVVDLLRTQSTLCRS